MIGRRTESATLNRLFESGRAELVAIGKNQRSLCFSSRSVRFLALNLLNAFRVLPTPIDVMDLWFSCHSK